MVTDSVIGLNLGSGIQVNGPGSRLCVGNTSISANGNGVTIVGGFVNTYGNNRNDGNGTDGAFTLPIIPQE